MKDTVLMPTYNEKKNIEEIIPEIFRLYPDLCILVIDDNSPDNTAGAVKRLMKKYSKLSILEREKKTGLKDAYFDAFKKLREDKEIRSVITMDADWSHSPKYLNDFLKNIDNYGLIIGSRYIKDGGVFNWELWRKILSRSANFYVKCLSGVKVNDMTSGFMCIRRELLEKFRFKQIDASGYAFLMQFKFHLIRDLGVKFKEIPIIFYDRHEGVTKFSHRIFFEGLRVPLKLFFKRFGVYKNLNIGEELWEKCWKEQNSLFNIIGFGRRIYNFFLFRFIKKYINEKTDFLEFGCGTASLGIKIAEKVNSYTGIDFEQNILRGACADFERAGLKNYCFEVKNVLNFESKKKFDIVWSQGFIEHFDDPSFLICKHLKMLKEGGRAVMSVPARYSYHHFWYMLTRFKLFRRFWPWPDAIFISKKMFSGFMEKLNINSSRYEVVYLKPRILGLLILIVDK